MKNKELYERTCEILYQAYFNDTLKHNNCFACACGNLVAANLGLEYVLDEQMHFSNPAHKLYWKGYAGYGSDPNGNSQNWYSFPEEEYEEAKRQREATGYDHKTFWGIEQAFEHCPKSDDPETHMYNGLVAVLEYLNEVHEVDQDEQTPRFTALRQSKSACHVQ